MTLRIGVPGPRAVDPITRIRSKITEDTNGCWIYGGYLNSYGYGLTFIGSRIDGSRRRAMTHRLMYEAEVGPIPDGLDLDHLCRVRACCRPSHLEPVDRRTNLLRGQTIPATNVAKTRCPQGHEYVGANLGHEGNARVCRACKAAYQRRLRAARRSS